VLACATLGSRNAQAGYVELPYQSCQHNADKSGHCEGEAVAWRTASLATDYITFEFGQARQDFFAVYGNANYSCVVPAGSPIAAVWPSLVHNEGYFSISWDKNGYCTDALATDGSWHPAWY
jgi:hypothetical protein